MEKELGIKWKRKAVNNLTRRCVGEAYMFKCGCNLFTQRLLVTMIFYFRINISLVISFLSEYFLDSFKKVLKSQ